jgi:hypothetical protein
MDEKESDTTPRHPAALTLFSNQVVGNLPFYRHGDTEGSGLTGVGASPEGAGRRIPTNNELRSIPLFRRNPTIKKI